MSTSDVVICGVQFALTLVVFASWIQQLRSNRLLDMAIRELDYDRMTRRSDLIAAQQGCLRTEMATAALKNRADRASEKKVGPS